MAQCGPVETEGNVGLAFGLVTAAGLSTTIGAAAAFVMPYSSDSKNLFLAASLSIAAGVMLYVSFVEIFVTKAIGDLELCYESKLAYLYATLCFFGGILFTYFFDKALHWFEHFMMKSKAAKNPSVSSADTRAASGLTIEISKPGAAHDIERQAAADSSELEMTPEDTNNPTDAPIQIDEEVGHDGHMVASIYKNPDADSRALIRMGIFAGLALAFHNFPEGLATFVAVLEDPSVGASVAIAIGIHNIPEGICVAMPIYYATGSKGKAFFWATLSGMTELVGAFLGWIVLRKVLSRVVYGVLFGIVGGMMVYISLKELLPTAHRYDPEDKVTTYGLLFGMFVMALSLVLFQF